MKGMRGRFRQGLYPMAAPLGYLDNGRAKPKTSDPERAPLLRHAFERYASGDLTLRTLRLEMHMAGLRNRSGRPVSINGWSRILNNLFYAGQLRLRRTGEVFAGVHEPLICQGLFERVQEVLRRRSTRQARVRHHFTFRRQLLCTRCGRCVVGELKKGRVYYRCHNRSCPGVCVRTDRIDAALLSGVLRKNPDPTTCIRVRIPAWGCQKSLNAKLPLQQKSRSLSDFSEMTHPETRVTTGGHSNDSIRTPEDVVEEAWVIGKEQLQKAREEQERLARERQEKERAKKSEPASPPAYHPNSIQAILGRWDSDSAAGSSGG